MAPPQYPCSYCGSNRFEEEDGIWVCESGHQQEGGQQIGEDDADFARVGKITRKKQLKEKQKASKVYRGVEGVQLFLKAWQFILWKQSHALIHQHGMPADLWKLVRELWSLWLRRIVNSLDASPADESDLSTSSQSDTEPDDCTRLDHLKTNKQMKDIPKLLDTIALNCIGMLLLRLPTRLSTVYLWIRQEQICFIRAITSVPAEIREKLASEYHLSLDTTTIPMPADLQLAVCRVATMYGSVFTVNLPPLNWILVLYEHIQDLALPLEVFPAVKYLAGLLGYTFTYPKSHRGRRNAITYPEAQLMAIIVVATKLLFPFQSELARVHLQPGQESIALKLNWETWLNVRKTHTRNGDDQELDPKDAIEITDADVFKMTENQLDQYMDWFQQTYTQNFDETNTQKQLLDMFPLMNISSPGLNQSMSISERRHEILRAVQITLEPQIRVDGQHSTSYASENLRVGQSYPVYRSLEEMPEPAIEFHKQAAQLACLPTATLLRACLTTEQLLFKYQHEQRRTELFMEDLVGSE